MESVFVNPLYYWLIVNFNDTTIRLTFKSFLPNQPPWWSHLMVLTTMMQRLPITVWKGSIFIAIWTNRWWDESIEGQNRWAGIQWKGQEGSTQPNIRPAYGKGTLVPKGDWKIQGRMSKERTAPGRDRRTTRTKAACLRFKSIFRMPFCHKLTSNRMLVMTQ